MRRRAARMRRRAARIHGARPNRTWPCRWSLRRFQHEIRNPTTPSLAHARSRACKRFPAHAHTLATDSGACGSVH